MVLLTVQAFAPYVDVWRVFDFLNHVPNMVSVFEEVKRAGKYLEPAVCFSTGPEHTDAYYAKKVAEILEVTGPDILLAIKNHSGLGRPSRIYRLIHSLLVKLTVYGYRWIEATSRLDRALSNFVITGLKTTIPFYRKLVADPEFQSGHFDTGYLDRHPELFRYDASEREESKIARLLAEIHHQQHNPFAS